MARNLWNWGCGTKVPTTTTPFAVLLAEELYAEEFSFLILNWLVIALVLIPLHFQLQSSPTIEAILDMATPMLVNRVYLVWTKFKVWYLMTIAIYKLSNYLAVEVRRLGKDHKYIANSIDASNVCSCSENGVLISGSYSLWQNFISPAWRNNCLVLTTVLAALDR